MPWQPVTMNLILLGRILIRGGDSFAEHRSFHDSLLVGYDWAGEEFLLYFLARGRWKESVTGEDSNNSL